ncbi:MAG: N-acetyl-gamma-glutamyl-phosphate reductase [Bacillota bacterium]|nr:N-acetyl-gamma-glutamyl-phosphate reductase [Bacillota bacterium]MDO4860430.1 N-acetyl-gamma-glutamyl-phosphate reductase [Bacillota bacterium]
MIKVGVVGATGYAGSDLMRMLVKHPEVDIKYVTANSYVGKKYAEVYPNFNKHIPLLCSPADLEKVAEECDVLFTALPGGMTAGLLTETILDKTRVIDFGAAYRLKDVKVYEKWYGEAHKSPQFIEEAVYGLCEFNRDKIKDARLIANPGCHTTCGILGTAPLVKYDLIDRKSIIIDSKTGVSGAGRGLNRDMLFCEANENTKAYKVAGHRHTPEIEEQLTYVCGEDIVISFTPVLVPMNRGILATIYATLKDGVTEADIAAAYEKMYGDEYFIRLSEAGTLPESKWVKGSNFVDIGFKVDERTNRVIAISSLDNLVKGAAGQALQNMNIMFGLDEKTGLDQVTPFPV